MKRVNSQQYRNLTKFCKAFFKNQKFATKKQLNLLIQNHLSPYSSRYLKNMMSLGLIEERNLVYFPGKLLTHFKLIDYQSITKLEKSGTVKIIETNKVKYIPKDPKAETDFPAHWELESKCRGVLIFKVK